MYNNPYNYNPYFKQPMYQPMEQPVQPINTQSYIPPIQQTKPVVLQGKSVDSIDVVKATEIPLDGSISYFPLADNSVIATKQLMPDGTSKITIYKPVEGEDKKEETPKIDYITKDDLNESIKNIDLSGIDSLREEINDLRKEIKDLRDTRRGK